MDSRPFDRPETARIAAFLEAIGISVTAVPLPEETLLPGVAVRGGDILVDPERLQWPGDLLHEAGHIAVTQPERRAALAQVSEDGGEEMAAIAWSWAAGAAIGLAPEILFHDGGYRGGGRSLIDAFAGRAELGVPLLVWFGMTGGWQPKEPGRAAFPAMDRWLR